jgi:hypothetical protein
MNIPRVFLLAAAVVLATAAAASAQTIIQITPNGVPQGSPPGRELTDEELLHFVFSNVGP